MSTATRTYRAVKVDPARLDTGLPFESGRAADHRVTYAQIDTGNLMACGARDFVHDDRTGAFYFRVGPGGQTLRKVFVRLMADDTYSVEYGYSPMTRKAMADDTWGRWHPVERVDHVYAESLGAVVRRLGDRES